MWRRGLFVSKSLRRITAYGSQSQHSMPVGVMESSSPFRFHRHALYSSVTNGATDTLVYESPPFLNGFQHSDSGANVSEPEAVQLKKMDELLRLLKEDAVDESLESNFDLILNGEDELEMAHISENIQFQTLNYHSVIRLMHWAIRRNKFRAGQTLTPSLIETLVRTVLKKSTAAPLWAFLKQCALEFDVIPSDVSQFNKFIYFFSQLGNEEEILEAFSMISELGLSPDSDSFYLTIVGLCKSSCYDQAAIICEKMLEVEALPELPAKIGYIIRLLCKADKATMAHLVYCKAKKLSKDPPFSDFSLLISSLTRKDETVRLAANTLDDLLMNDLKAAIKPFSLVIRGLCRMKDVEAANKLLSQMISCGPPPGHDIFNRIIACYSKIGDMEGAARSMKLMESRGLKPDVYTYTVIISGYVRAGLMKEACDVLSLAKQNHSKLTQVTYHSLIRGYCKLEQFNEALKLLAEMKNFGVIPNVDEYNKMVQSLCVKALDWETSEKLLKEMEESGLHLNEITKSLIRAVKELDQEQRIVA